MGIGVGITTRGRRPLFLDALNHWLCHLPAEAVIVVVDDASAEPLPDLDPRVHVIRHQHRLGVAMSKNRCISELIDAGCDELFLSDDDVHPLVDDWWKPYVESSEPHLMYGWPHTRRAVANGTGWPPRIVDGDEQHDAYSFPRGVLLYLTKKVVEVVGGMNPAHGAFSGEHVEYSGRIHDAGLTSWAFADVKDSQRIWYSRDREVGNTTGSSFPLKERRRLHAANSVQWGQKFEGWPHFPCDRGVRDFSLGPYIEPVEHYALLRHVVGLHPFGVAVEAGVGCGESTRIIAAEMPVIGLDSFAGLETDWRPEFPRGSFAHEAPDIPNVQLVIGWYKDTLPNLELPDAVGLLHLDADTYQATREVLERIGPHLLPGSYVVMDEALNYDDGPGASWRDHEYKAWAEFVEQAGIGFVSVGHSHEAWAVRIV